MPTDTFNKLPEEKKTKVILAAKKEFTRASLKEASIKNIVEEAGIARGSFYQYFKNKDDAFDYFVEESSKRIKEKVVKRISSVHGDIFELCETVFDEIVVAGSDKKWQEIIFHVVPYTNMNKLEPISHYIENMNREEWLVACSSLGIGNLDIKDENEVMDIIGVIEALFQSALPKVFSEEENREELRKQFRRRLNIVRKATVREGV